MILYVHCVALVKASVKNWFGIFFYFSVILYDFRILNWFKRKENQRATVRLGHGLWPRLLHSQPSLGRIRDPPQQAQVKKRKKKKKKKFCIRNTFVSKTV
jgi:hypothetical protein